MNNKSNEEIFLEYMPILTIKHKIVVIYLLQFAIFSSVIVFFWWISSRIIYGALIGQIIIVFLGTLPYSYIANNIHKFREKYRKKYDKLACQKLWLHYESYTIPLLSSSLYFPLLLHNYSFLPRIINLNSHFLTKQIFPDYFAIIAIIIGILLVLIGILIGKPSGGFGPDVESYFYLLYPEKGKLITEGIYQYIRNPRYLGRGLIAIGFGFIANNTLAIVVGFIHSIAFFLLIIPEDKELERRFDGEFISYKKRVPALFPKFGNWRKFLKFI